MQNLLPITHGLNIQLHQAIKFFFQIQFFYFCECFDTPSIEREKAGSKSFSILVDIFINQDFTFLTHWSCLFLPSSSAKMQPWQCLSQEASLKNPYLGNWQLWFCCQCDRGCFVQCRQTTTPGLTGLEFALESVNTLKSWTPQTQQTGLGSGAELLCMFAWSPLASRHFSQNKC